MFLALPYVHPSIYILGNACNYIIKKGDSTIAVTSQLCMIMMAIHMVMDK